MANNYHFALFYFRSHLQYARQSILIGDDLLDALVKEDQKVELYVPKGGSNLDYQAVLAEVGTGVTIRQ